MPNGKDPLGILGEQKEPVKDPLGILTEEQVKKKEPTDSQPSGGVAQSLWQKTKEPIPSTLTSELLQKAKMPTTGAETFGETGINIPFKTVSGEDFFGEEEIKEPTQPQSLTGAINRQKAQEKFEKLPQDIYQPPVDIRGEGDYTASDRKYDLQKEFVDAITSDNYLKATASRTALKKEFPEDTYADKTMGDYYYKQGNLQSAKIYYDLAAQNNDKDAIKSRMLVNYTLGDDEAGQKDAKQILKDNPDDWESNQILSGDLSLPENEQKYYKSNYQLLKNEADKKALADNGLELTNFLRSVLVPMTGAVEGVEQGVKTIEQADGIKEGILGAAQIGLGVTMGSSVVGNLFMEVPKLVTSIFPDTKVVEELLFAPASTAEQVMGDGITTTGKLTEQPKKAYQPSTEAQLIDIVAGAMILGLLHKAPKAFMEKISRGEPLTVEEKTMVGEITKEYIPEVKPLIDNLKAEQSAIDTKLAEQPKASVFNMVQMITPKATTIQEKVINGLKFNKEEAQEATTELMDARNKLDAEEVNPQRTMTTEQIGEAKKVLDEKISVYKQAVSENNLKLIKDDYKDKTRIPSEIEKGEEPIITELDKGTGEETISTGGVVQKAPEIKPLFDKPAKEIDIDLLTEEDTIPEIESYSKERGIEILPDDKEMVYDAFQQELENNPEMKVADVLDKTLLDYDKIKGEERIYEEVEMPEEIIEPSKQPSESEKIYFDEKGNKTRKHTSLLIWGHNPEKNKYEKGGEIKSSSDSVDSVYEDAINEFKKREYVITKGSDSKTDFGHSRYFYVNRKKNPSSANLGNGLKIRVSDHSVENFGRMRDEYHISTSRPEFTRLLAIKDVDLYLKPENFKTEYYQSTKTVNNIEVNEKEYNPLTDKILKERINKAGTHKVYLIDRTTPHVYKRFVNLGDNSIVDELITLNTKEIELLHKGELQIIKTKPKIKEELQQPIVEEVKPPVEVIETPLMEEGIKPPEPPKTPTDVGETPKLSGIKKELIPETKIGEAELKKRTQEETLQEAREKIKSGEVNPQAIIDAVNNKTKRVLDTDEIAALVSHKVELDAKYDKVSDALSDAKSKGDFENIPRLQVEFDSIQKNLNDYYKMSEATAYEQGAAFAMRQVLLDSEYNLQTQLRKFKDANKGELTPEVEAKFKEYADELEFVKKELRDFEKNYDIKKREQIFDEQSKKVKRTKTVEDVLKEFDKEFGIQEAAIAKEYVPYVKKMSEVKELKGKNLKETVDFVYDKLEGKIKDITKKDVEDILTEEKPTKDKLIKEKARAKRELTDIEINEKRLEKLQKKLEDIKKGITPDDRRIVEKSKEVKKLKEEITETKKNLGLTPSKELDVARAKRELTDEEQIRERKIRLEKSIKEYERLIPLIPSGAWKKVKKTLPDLDTQGLELEIKKNQIKDKFDYEVEVARLKNRPLKQKITDLIIDTTNLPKSLVASADLSAPFRQGAWFSYSHPIIGAKAFAEMFKFTFSEKKYQRFLDHLRATPEYQQMKKAGLFIAEPTSKLSAKEETFMTNIAQKIPLWGHVVKGSERAYAGFLNKLRVDMFADGVDYLEKQGYDIKKNPDVFEALAKYINNGTGRGDLGVFEKSATILNTAMFSPRLVASRFNLLNPYTYIKMPKEVRKMALKDAITFIGVGSTALMLASAAGADVELDPRSSDFGKIKIGNTRFDVWGGFQQWVRMLSQAISGQRKSTKTGEIKELSAKEFPYTTRAGVIGGFIRGKLSPTASTIMNILSGETAMGEKPTAEKEALEKVIPLYISDIKEIYEEEGLPNAIGASIPSLFGVGVQFYSDTQQRLQKLKDWEEKETSTTYSDYKKKREKEIDQYIKDRDVAEKEGILDKFYKKEGTTPPPKPKSEAEWNKNKRAKERHKTGKKQSLKGDFGSGFKSGF